MDESNEFSDDDYIGDVSISSENNDSFVEAKERTVKKKKIAGKFVSSETTEKSSLYKS